MPAQFVIQRPDQAPNSGGGGGDGSGNEGSHIQGSQASEPSLSGENPELGPIWALEASHPHHLPLREAFLATGEFTQEDLDIGSGKSGKGKSTQNIGNGDISHGNDSGDDSQD